MKRLEHSNIPLKTMLDLHEWLGIYGCIRETRNRTIDSYITEKIGADRAHLYSIVKYFQAVRHDRDPDLRSQSPTLALVKIHEDEYHLTMSPEDAKIIGKCLKIALRKVPDWEFHILLGVYPYEIKDLLKKLKKIV